MLSLLEATLGNSCTCSFFKTQIREQKWSYYVARVYETVLLAMIRPFLFLATADMGTEQCRDIVLFARYLAPNDQARVHGITGTTVFLHDTESLGL